MSMEIRRIDSGILCSNMYILREEDHIIVIDPSRDISQGKGLRVDLLLITHEHYDHISGVNAWKEAYQVPLLCSQACAARIVDAKKNQARHFDSFCEIQSWVKIDAVPEIDTTYVCEADQTFCDTTEFSWKGHLFQLEEIPGHSPGSIGIYVDHSHFFSGDSLLENGTVELRFPGGDKKTWQEIGKKRIDAIPNGTIIWPGHFDSFIKEC